MFSRVCRKGCPGASRKVQSNPTKNGDKGGDKMRHSVTVLELNALPPGESMTVHMTGKGAGAVLFKSGVKAITAYFRQRVGQKDQLVKIGKIGRLESKNRNEEITSLKTVMREAERLYVLAASVKDVKAHLENESIGRALEAERKKAELVDLQRQQSIHNARGTLSDLLQSYIDCGGKQDAMRAEIQRVLDKEIKKDNPEIGAKKARDVTSEDIVIILRKIYLRGSKSMANKVRTYLHTAYSHGLKNRYSYTDKLVSESKLFELVDNPVKLIPKNFTEAAGERSLSKAELRQFYITIDKTKGISERMGLLFKLNVQLGGQRILQLARAPWASYELDRGVVKLLDLKGRPPEDADAKKAKIHILPITKAASSLVMRLREISDGFYFPFSEDGKTPYTVSSFAHATRAWLKSENSKINGVQIPHFTPRDLRRTCNQMLVSMGIPINEANILQSHGLTGVVMRHYLNNPELFVADKENALVVFEKKLGKILKAKPSKI